MTLLALFPPMPAPTLCELEVRPGESPLQCNIINIFCLSFNLSTFNLLSQLVIRLCVAAAKNNMQLKLSIVVISGIIPWSLGLE